MVHSVEVDVFLMAVAGGQITRITVISNLVLGMRSDGVYIGPVYKGFTRFKRVTYGISWGFPKL